jgi:hypothetical protein
MLQAIKCCPVKVKGGVETSVGKVNVLLQTYISNGYVDASTLISDSYYVTQVIISEERARVLALFEINS